MAPGDAVRTMLVLLDLRVVRRAQRAQVVEPIGRGGVGHARARDDVVHRARRRKAARHRAAVAVALQRRPAQRLPVRGRVITVSRQLPTMEARHERANRITVEAIKIARRDGRTAAERHRIYDREVERLMAEEPAYRNPPPVAPSAAEHQPRGLLFRF